jgi:hypothetical protein
MPDSDSAEISRGKQIQKSKDKKSMSPDTTLVPSLPDLGIARDQSSKWTAHKKVGKFSPN